MFKNIILFMVEHYDLTAYIFELALILVIIESIHLGLKIYERFFE